MAPVERVDAGHVSVVQFEVEDVEVVPNALRVDRLGDGDEAALEVSAQDDLDHALFVLARELLQGGVGENPALAMGLHASVTMPFDWWKARSSFCCI